MKKCSIIIVAMIVVLSCSKKNSEDFVGVYKFKIMNKYNVTDTSETVGTIYGLTPLVIVTHRLIPFTFDYFKVGEEIKGTLTITQLQTDNGLKFINEQSNIKLDLKNIHVINDTLVSEIVGRKKASILKLVKNSDGVYLIMDKDKKTKSEAETTNLFADMTSDKVIYKAFEGSKDDELLIINSNNKAAEKTIEEYIKDGYRPEKRNYLKSILTNAMNK